jgi:predicted nucleic acid-binding protein
MIILDTSILIEYLKKNNDYIKVVDKLLLDKQVLAFDFIFGELLQGARQNEFEKLLTLWELLPKVNLPNVGFYAGKLSFDNKLKDSGIGLIDCAIIYATVETGSKLWTLDKKILKNIDNEFIFN